MRVGVGVGVGVRASVYCAGMGADNGRRGAGAGVEVEVRSGLWPSLSLSGVVIRQVESMRKAAKERASAKELAYEQFMNCRRRVERLVYVRWSQRRWGETVTSAC